MTLFLHINKGHNEQMAQKCKTLKDYAFFVDKVREYGETMPLSDAVSATTKYCMEQGILIDFLRINATEVVNMLTDEWDWDVAKEVWQEEARDEGRDEGRTEGWEMGRAEAAVHYEAERTHYETRIAELEAQLAVR
jgi:hypothetical protein